MGGPGVQLPANTSPTHVGGGGQPAGSIAHLHPGRGRGRASRGTRWSQLTPLLSESLPGLDPSWDRAASRSEAYIGARFLLEPEPQRPSLLWWLGAAAAAGGGKRLEREEAVQGLQEEP
ncbi:unnamed protein product [Caretta caretta]